MSKDEHLDRDTIEKVAYLARLRLEATEIPELTQRITAVLNMVDQMQAIDTDAVEPMANPLDATQRLRPDIVREENQRDDFQKIAPQAEQGLYLVPKVIE